MIQLIEGSFLYFYASSPSGLVNHLFAFHQSDESYTHTDFRIYWSPRLSALTEYLHGKDIELEIIEIAGAGSPYLSLEIQPHTQQTGTVFSQTNEWKRSRHLPLICIRRKLNDLNGYCVCRCNCFSIRSGWGSLGS